ncbi:hypothetical protein [Rhodococcoides yunnanense]|uniref:hypothetical protein n=1 Tax=Rhodococcoides yunnanense TaxID=278209 RepID=UPI0022B13369|nr:hypothetical protein [Rhodococcus yunnanensis]MCZ4278852.1 hypothetical protein [Rhodococcus yunnanensis]
MLLGADDFDAMQETIAVLSDAELRTAHCKIRYVWASHWPATRTRLHRTSGHLPFLYLIDDEKRIVQVTAISQRADACRFTRPEGWLRRV